MLDTAFWDKHRFLGHTVVAKIRQADRNFHRYYLAQRVTLVSGLTLGVAGGILTMMNPAFGILGLVSTGVFTVGSTLEFGDRAEKQKAVKLELMRLLNPDIAKLSYVLNDLDPELCPLRGVPSATVRLAENTRVPLKDVQF